MKFENSSSSSFWKRGDLVQSKQLPSNPERTEKYYYPIKIAVECKSDGLLNATILFQLFKEIENLWNTSERQECLFIITLGLTGEFHIFHFKDEGFIPTRYSKFNLISVKSHKQVKLTSENQISLKKFFKHIIQHLM